MKQIEIKQLSEYIQVHFRTGSGQAPKYYSIGHTYFFPLAYSLQCLICKRTSVADCRHA